MAVSLQTSDLLQAWVQSRGLAVVPVEKEQGEGTHHEEEKDPYSEASIVLDGLAGGAQVLAHPGLVLDTVGSPPTPP